jgi:hypothetical protein
LLHLASTHDRLACQLVTSWVTLTTN